MNKRKQDIAIGLIIILIGVLSLLSRIDFFYSMSHFVFGALFLFACGYFIRLFLQNRKQWWRLLLALILGFFGIGFVLESFVNLPGGVYGILLFLAIALAFAYIYARNSSQWWSVIPAGIGFTLATIVALDTLKLLDSDYLGVLFLFGSGLTFIFLWTQRTSENKLQWAVFPGIVFILLAVFVYIDQNAWLHSDVLFPLLLVTAGILLILNTIRIHKHDKSKNDT